MGETFTGESGILRSERVSVGRQIEFNAIEHRHFDHGYAVTSHSSQGLTAERVLVHADTRAHPDLLNFRFGCVSIDMAKLEPPLRAQRFEDLSSGNQSRLIGGPEIGIGI
jgi:hypothetical protein